MSRLHPKRKPAKYGTKKRVVHTGKAVIALLPDGQHRTMAQRDAVSQMGRSKGGLTAQQRGTAHRFTSAEASKAAKKLWATRYKMNHRIGTRLGRPAKLSAPVRRPALREKHVFFYGCPAGVYYLSSPWMEGLGIYQPQWVVRTADRTVGIGERTALRKLGYLPYPRKGVIPVSYVPAPDVRRLGRKRAAVQPGSWSVHLLPGVK